MSEHMEGQFRREATAGRRMALLIALLTGSKEIALDASLLTIK